MSDQILTGRYVLRCMYVLIGYLVGLWKLIKTVKLINQIIIKI